MDPSSASPALFGTINAVIRTASAIVGHFKDTIYFSSNRILLVKETQILLKLLKQLRDRGKPACRSESWLNDHKVIVRQFDAAYDDLAMTIKYDTATGEAREENRFQPVKIMSKWSFTKSEIYSLLERVTRLQQYANLLLADDHQ